MDQHYSFYIVFLGQVLLISYFLPRRLLARMRHVVRSFPPADYPRLYPVPIKKVEKAQRSYRNLNRLALGFGLALVAIGIFAPTRDMLGWDTVSVMNLYLMLQLAPLLIAMRPGFIYFNPLRRQDTRSQRTADLRPRRLFDFVSPLSVGFAIALYLAFGLFVLWVKRFDYSWFGGYWNIVGVTVLNLLMVVGIVSILRRRRRDPYQAAPDRQREMAFGVRMLVLTSSVATLSITLSILLAMLELRPFIPVTKSLYFMLVAAVCFRQFRIDGVDFEVYREDLAPAVSAQAL